MGLAALPRIARQLLDHGLAADVPVAVIEKGTTPDQRVVMGALDSIADTVRRNDLAGPALTIIGGVAGFARADRTATRIPAVAAAG